MSVAQQSFHFNKEEQSVFFNQELESIQNLYSFEKNKLTSINKKTIVYEKGIRQRFKTQVHIDLEKLNVENLGDVDFKSKKILTLYHKLWDILIQYYSNPLVSVSTSKTMLLPHQVQAATRIVESMQPRFLIADEVGLGKTIEAGLIIKELKIKNNYEKIMIVVPAPLMTQWQSELRYKFNETYEVITGQKLKRDKKILFKHKQILVSVDFAKDPKYTKLFLEQNYDIVIFDEAHRLRRDQNKVTKAYQFAETISANTKALLLLSATPFRGKIEEIYFLIKLIDPDILGPLHRFLRKYDVDEATDLKDKIAPVVIRRRKVDIGGFTKRFAKTVKLTLPGVERAFYDQTTEYVKREYNMAMTQGQSIKSFVMIIFQKLLDSSSYALLTSLKKRKLKLENILQRVQSGTFTQNKMTKKDRDELEFAIENDEDGLDDLLTELHEFDPKELQQEIYSLSQLIELGSQIEVDNKLVVLKKNIKLMQKIGHKKFIVFTQFKNTLDYISNYLQKDFKISVFHGGMTMQKKDEAVENFFNDTEVLICTEAAGEGRNLQIASALFNYDLPWSPLRVEQRIGRIHRFGQKKDVHIINFASKDTVAERILDILTRKIKLFEDALGESDILLGAMEDELKFHKTFAQFLQKKKTKKELMVEIDKSVQLAKANLGKINQLLSTEFLSFNMNAFDSAVKKKDNGKIYQQALEKIIEKYLIINNTFFKKDKLIFTFKREKKQIKGTFDYDMAISQDYLEYLSFGHDFVDTHIQEIINQTEDKLLYFTKSVNTGILFHFQVKINLDRMYKRFYKIFIPSKIDVNEIKKILIKSQKKIFKIIQLEKALQLLQTDIDLEVNKIKTKLNTRADYLTKNIQTSHQNHKLDLEEKLQLQKGKSRWYGSSKMASAITRTQNDKIKEDLRFQNRIMQIHKNMQEKILIDVKHICIKY